MPTYHDFMKIERSAIEEHYLWGETRFLQGLKKEDPNFDFDGAMYHLWMPDEMKMELARQERELKAKTAAVKPSSNGWSVHKLLSFLSIASLFR